MSTATTLLIPDYQENKLYAGEVMNNITTEETGELVGNAVIGQGFTLKQNEKESINRRTKAWGLEPTSGWRLFLEFGLTRNANNGFEKISDDPYVEIPLTDNIKQLYGEYYDIVSDIIIAWRDCVLKMNKGKKDKTVDQILLNGNLYDSQMLTESRGIVGKYSGFTEINELSFSKEECIERFLNILFINLNKKKNEVKINEFSDITYYLDTFDKNISDRVKIRFTSNTLSKGKKNPGFLSIARKEIADIDASFKITNEEIIYMFLVQELESLIEELRNIKQKSKAALDKEYKDNGQNIPKKPTKDECNYDNKLRDYNDYNVCCTMEAYKWLLDTLSKRYGKAFSFYQYYADVYMSIPEALYHRLIVGTENYNSHNHTELTSRQYIELLYKDCIDKQDGLKIARNKKITIDPEKMHEIKYPFYDPQTEAITEIPFVLTVNDMVHSEIEKLAKSYGKNIPEMIDYALTSFYGFLSGYEQNGKAGFNPILKNLQVSNASEYMKLTARKVLLAYLYDRLEMCLPYENYKMEEYYHDIITSAFWYLSQKIENM